jgi:wyosine [tRNA(Phe)-imidazoG37] synthetase (radical SAM superfamily)
MRDELTAMIRFAKDGGLAKEPKFNQVPWLTRDIRDLAFSGDGEPTLINNFAECVRVVAEVKQAEQLSRSKIVLITDAAGLDKTDVREGLRLMDSHNGEVWGKLDAGTEAFFKRVNRTNIRFDRILRNLLETAKTRPIVIQSLFMKLEGIPPSPEELNAYCQRLRELLRDGAQIKEVHVYSPARPTPEPFVSKLSGEDLQAVADLIHRETGLAAPTFG